MAYINSIDAEGIQAGAALVPPLATVDIWQSIDPTKPFALQTTGINNLNGLTNQIGTHNAFGLSNAFGSHFKFGTSTAFGMKADLGVKADAIIKKFEGTPAWSAASPVGTFFGTFNVVGSLTANGVPVELVSDIKLKENIKPLENSLDKVKNLRGVEYDRIDLGWHEIGLVAQEVEEVIPDLVRENSEGTKVLEYTHLTAVLVEAIKEQQKQIETLKETVAELSTKLAEYCTQCYDGWVSKTVPTMQITRDQLEELNGILEDVASHFCGENMVSGETFWTCVECFATAKVAELRGELAYDG